uniref:Protein regulator of cytokinesis 1-like n=1 Tax=Petromyzon marinus TaxID=7757 RepID=A0AAJ7TCP3_PETMA|nr:protein regulator of cytokinesis 1-like [Petromyzon marinus]
MARKSEVLASELVASLNHAMVNLRDIWEDIGIPEEQRLERTQVVKKYMERLLNEMVSEEEALKDRLMKSVATCKMELQGLCSDLSLPAFQPDENLTLLQLEKDTRTRMETLVREKRERLRELQSLDDAEERLCGVLCERRPHRPPTSGPVPSIEQLALLRQAVATLVAEKTRRQELFTQTRQQIVMCMAQLERSPDSSFERDVACEDEEEFCLSKDNILSLQTLLTQLERECALNDEVCSELRDEVGRLWDRLNVEQGERDAFTACVHDSKPSDMDKLKQELSRLVELKRQNVRTVLAGVRSEIAALWEKCYVSEEEQRAFTPYHSDDATEELLVQHEEEANRLRGHHEQHRALYDGVRRWDAAWQQYLEFERRAADPNRFSNRGGSLLREEKQRAHLQKGLPKLEEDLKAQIAVWEEQAGRRFQVAGRPLLDYIAAQWEAFKQEREREKIERQVKKVRTLEEEMAYGSQPKTPSKRRFCGTNTPNKTRRMNATTVAQTGINSTLFRSAASGTMCNSPVSANGKPPTSERKTPGRTCGRPPRPPLAEHNSRTPSRAPTPTSSLKCVASYSEFTRDLSQARGNNFHQDILNSTVTSLGKH